MIYIRFGIAVKDKGGNPHPVKMTKLTQFRNEYDFGFDIMKPENWRKFLAEYVDESTGKRLPRMSQYGDPVVYYVYLFGSSRWIRSSYSDNRPFINLFPGTQVYETKDGEIRKGKSVARFGRI